MYKCVTLCNRNSYVIARCVRALIQCGGDVEREDSRGRTPLFLACEQGHVECVKLLLDAGADRSHVTTVSSHSCTVSKTSIPFCMLGNTSPFIHLHGYLNSRVWARCCLRVARNVIMLPVLVTLNAPGFLSLLLFSCPKIFREFLNMVFNCDVA